MTALIQQNNYVDDYTQLNSILIDNLPPKIRAGMGKETANKEWFEAHIALRECSFINFNTKGRIAFMIFDIDHYEGQDAKEYFGNMYNFQKHILETIKMEPTYILETDKGFHFGFHLMNHIYTHQEKPLRFLEAIKTSIINKLHCDKNASSRMYGVYRNPLRHPFIFTNKVDYELKEFVHLLERHIEAPKKPKEDRTHTKVHNTHIELGNRNNAIFYKTMRQVKNLKNITFEEIYWYAQNFNLSSEDPLETNEIRSICKSVFKYYSENKIFVPSLEKREINEGIMNFTKMKNLTKEEYDDETKRRRQLSAKRTNEIIDRKKREQHIKNIQKKRCEDLALINTQKVKEAAISLSEENLKITISSLARFSGLSRATVKKYYDQLSI